MGSLTSSFTSALERTQYKVSGSSASTDRRLFRVQDALRFMKLPARSSIDPGPRKWDASSFFKSPIAAPGHQVGLFNAPPIRKLDKNDIIEGCVNEAEN
jgi:hypothetical protein